MAVELDTTGNGAIDIEKGGTNATSAAQALSNLGGQPFDADLTTLSSGTYAQKRAIIESAAKPVLDIDTLRTTVADFDGDVRFLVCHTSLNDGGQGTFVWDADSTAADNNGTIIAVAGVATGRWVRQVGDKVDVRWFGLVSYDDTEGVTNYTAIRRAMTYCLTRNPLAEPYDGQAELVFPEGTIYVSGNSPLMLNRTELEALTPSYRYRRGMKISGAGRWATNLILQNNGSQSWFADNYDGNYAENQRSIALTWTFSNMSFRAYAGYTPVRKYSVAEALQVSGFRFYSAGGESQMLWENCAFLGLDNILTIRGTGNGDKAMFVNCMAQNTIESCLDFGNDQAVQTRLFNTDLGLTYGHTFKIGPKGGGDFKMYGGSVALFPKQTSSNLPDVAATDIRGFVYIDLEDATAPTLSFGNNKFVFNDLRFEFYDDYQKLVHATRDAGTIGGNVDIIFNNSTFTNENNMNASGAAIAAPNTLREFVTIQNNIGGSVKFNNCNLNKRHQYVIRDNDASYLSATQIKFQSCGIYWDVLAATLGGDLRSRCILDSTDDGGFVAEDTKALIPPSASFPRYKTTLDFQYNMFAAGMVESLKTKAASLKSTQYAWPYVGVSGLRAYLPEGSVVTGIKLYKPAQDPPAGTPVNLYYSLIDPSANVLWSSTNQSEVLAVNENALLTDIYIVPASPNNYLNLNPQGSGGSAQPTGGVAILEYY